MPSAHSVSSETVREWDVWSSMRAAGAMEEFHMTVAVMLPIIVVMIAVFLRL